MAHSEVPDALLHLHKGLGIRRRDLLKFTKPMRARWELPDREPPARLRARLIWHIGNALSLIGGETVVRIGRAAYNLDTDPGLCQLDFMKRLDAAGDGRSRSWAHRIFVDAVQEHVTAYLWRPLDVPPDVLQGLLSRELDFARLTTDPRMPRSVRMAGTPSAEGREELHLSIRQLYTSPYEGIVERFLKSPVIVPRADRPGLIVTKTRRAGTWVSAYSDLDLLRAHAAGAGLPWNGSWNQVSGEALIRMMRALPEPAGVILNPPPTPQTSDISRTLPLTASTVRRIWDRL